MVEKEKLMDIYVHLAAYKRRLGMQMEEVETKMGKLEKIMKLSHPEAMNLRLEGMGLVELAEKI